MQANGNRKRIPLFVSDSCFVRSVVQELAPDKWWFKERATLLTGPELPGLRVITRMGKPLKYSEQSAGGLRASASSCADTMIEFLQQGNRTQVIAHSHPGAGHPAVTTPSGIDIDFMTDLQQGMHVDVIGMIVVRFDAEETSYVRFFSPCVDFKVRITGRGVKLIEERKNEYVFALAATPPSLDGESS